MRIGGDDDNNKNEGAPSPLTALRIRSNGGGALPVRLAAFAALGTTGGLAAFATFRSTRRTAPGRPHFEGTVFDGRRDLVKFRSLELAALVGIEGGEGSVALAQFRGSFRWRRRSRAVAALSTLPAGTAGTQAFQ